jgi:hypothetical protein
MDRGLVHDESDPILSNSPARKLDRRATHPKLTDANPPTRTWTRRQKLPQKFAEFEILDHLIRDVLRVRWRRVNRH